LRAYKYQIFNYLDITYKLFLIIPFTYKNCQYTLIRICLNDETYKGDIKNSFHSWIICWNRHFHVIHKKSYILYHWLARLSRVNLIYWYITIVLFSNQAVLNSLIMINTSKFNLKKKEITNFYFVISLFLYRVSIILWAPRRVIHLGFRLMHSISYYSGRTNSSYYLLFVTFLCLLSLINMPPVAAPM